jgi:hypothetical protein
MAALTTGLILFPRFLWRHDLEDLLDCVDCTSLLVLADPLGGDPSLARSSAGLFLLFVVIVENEAR